MIDLHRDITMKLTFSNTTKALMLLVLSSTFSVPMANAFMVVTQAPDEQIVDAPEEDEEDLEVIGVVGQRTPAYFRVQMEKAEMDFYESFNALADNDDYKVICRREKRAGSRIASNVCYPKYLLDQLAAETQEALERGTPQPTLKDIEFKGQKEREKSLAYVEEVVIANPQLLQKLISLNEKKAAFESSKAGK